MKNFSFVAFTLIVCLFASCRENGNLNEKSGVPKEPKLIIGIVVDQMAYDYISRYYNKFSDKGFKRMLSGGFFCKNSYYDHFPTYTGPGHSIIFTGVDPKDNGIAANDWFDRDTRQSVYCCDDTLLNPVGTFAYEGRMSPVKLKVMTITDRLRLTSNFHSKVFGVSLKDRASILPAGHLANAAFWYNSAAKRFITSSYYMNKLPEWVRNFNTKDYPDSYANTVWNTMLPIREYTESTADDNNYEIPFTTEDKPVFPHNFPKLKYANHHLMEDSPFGNTVTKDFAIETIKNNNLGKGDYTDFLTINFASTDYVGHQFGPNSIEIEDVYLRLDKDLGEFLDYLDKYIGMDNVLMFLTADHGNAPNPQFLKDHKIDADNFNPYPFADSCSEYLAHTFGVDADSAILAPLEPITNQQIYLNRKTFYQKHLDINTVEDSLADYINRGYPGIEKAYPSHNLGEMSTYDNYAKYFYNGYYPATCGDVYLNYYPYWMEGHEMGGTTHGTPYTYDTHVPLIWYGWKVPHGYTTKMYSQRSIATTLAAILNITPDSKATAKPIIEITDKTGD